MDVENKLIDLQTLASGDILQLQTYRFQGHKGTKKIYIQANLHGAEIIGNAVIYELIRYFSTLKSRDIEGEILLIPFCNPTAVNQINLFFSTGRYSPYDGNNWNRLFGNYINEHSNLDSFIQKNINLTREEIQDNYYEKIIHKFQQKISYSQSRGISFSEHYRNQLHLLSLNANYVIDIHSSSVNSIDYLYCFDRRQKTVDYFLLDYAILMDQYDGYAFDEAFLNPWLFLEKKFLQTGRNITFDVESWTLELGSGMQINEESVTKGVQGILNYLSAKKVLNLKVRFPKNKKKLIQRKT